MKKYYFLLVAFLSLSQLLLSQNIQNEKDTIIEYKEYFCNPYRISGFSVNYSINSYSTFSKSNSHGVDFFSFVIPDYFDVPDWHELKQNLRHDSRYEIDGRMSFAKQLFNTRSYYHANIHFGVKLSFGNRLNMVYNSKYQSFAEDGYLDIDTVPDMVYNIDSMINKRKEYIQRTNDIGLSFAYMISSPPRNIIAGKIGLGAAVLFSVNNHIYENSSIYKSVKYFETSQSDKEYEFEELIKKSDRYNIGNSCFVRFFIPAAFSYKLGTTRNLSVSLYTVFGVELQKPIDLNIIYAYPYYAVGIGLKYYFVFPSSRDFIRL